MHRRHFLHKPTKKENLEKKLKEYNQLIADQEKYFEEEKKKFGTQSDRFKILEILLSDIPAVLIPLIAQYDVPPYEEQEKKLNETIAKAKGVQDQINRIEEYMFIQQNRALHRIG